MDWKQRLQKDLQDALRAQEQVRVNAIRLLIAALEKAQEEHGKQAFDPSNPEEAETAPDREQTLNQHEIQEVIRAEIERRRESAEQFRKHGQNEHADSEESEIVTLEGYLTAT